MTYESADTVTSDVRVPPPLQRLLAALFAGNHVATANLRPCIARPDTETYMTLTLPTRVACESGLILFFRLVREAQTVAGQPITVGVDDSQEILRKHWEDLLEALLRQ